jgi:hypothetical protein
MKSIPNRQRHFQWDRVFRSLETRRESRKRRRFTGAGENKWKIGNGMVA